MPRRTRSDGDLDAEHENEAPEGERLQRVLAGRGVASRRASESMISEGRVSVNGRLVTELGTRVDPIRDEIRVDSKVLRRQKSRFIILNKPSGFITTLNDERQRWTVMDLVNVQERVYPVGRLDRDTQGLLLLTNDGHLANRVMHPRYGLTKEYHVITTTRPSSEQLQDIKDGLLIAGRLVVPDECRLLRETDEGIVIKIVLHEGIYHVVRRMMEIVGIEVIRLRRVRLGPLSLQGVPPGSWRDLSAGELFQLYEAVGLPIADAERANNGRTIQVSAIGGFRHGSRSAAERSAPPTERQFDRPVSGSQERRPSERDARPTHDVDAKEQWKRDGQGERGRRPQRPDTGDASPRPSGPRRSNDAPRSRPPVGNRNRRPGGSR